MIKDKNLIFEILKNVIEAPSSELNSIHIMDIPFLEQFKNVRRCYFLNDLVGLKECFDYFQNQSLTHQDSSNDKSVDNSNKSLNTTSYKMGLEIIKLRLKIRNFNPEIKDIDSNDYEISNSYLNLSLDPVEKALIVELLAVEAILCDLYGLQDLSFKKNKIASQMAEQLGMKKKSCTLFYNGIVAMNHQTSTSLKICNLVEALQKATSCEDHNTQIAALTSLAREYDSLGCIHLAFEECAKAVTLAKQHCFGSYNYCGVLLLASQLAVKMGQLDLAREQLKLVEVFNFSEFLEEIKKTKSLIESSNAPESLSGDEQKLIQLLTSKPKNKYELIENLYGQGDSESLDNRLKQLFLRLRKKRKGLIHYNKKDAVYQLNY